MKNSTDFNFFSVSVKYIVKEEMPLDILEECFQDHVKILEEKFDIQFHIVQIKKTRARFICSCYTNFTEEDSLKESLVWVFHKIFSMFDPQIKTPIVLQWESIEK
jgi:hypothetical protein